MGDRAVGELSFPPSLFRFIAAIGLERTNNFPDHYGSIFRLQLIFFVISYPVPLLTAR